MTKKKILIVEDEEDVRQALALRIAAGGYKVITAENGAVGLDKINTELPDLIILDVVMPVMNGFEFFKEIRSRKGRVSKIPVLMLTARARMRDTFESLEAEAFLPKPVMVKELMDTINDLIGNRALVLNIDDFVKENIIKAVAPFNYTVSFVETEESFFSDLKDKRYRLLIAHLALIRKTPEEFIRGLSVMKEKNYRLIIYSDVTVEGLDAGDVLDLDETRKSWIKAGLKRFYDHRIQEVDFQEFVQACHDDLTIKGQEEKDHGAGYFK